MPRLFGSLPQRLDLGPAPPATARTFDGLARLRSFAIAAALTRAKRMPMCADQADPA